MLSAVPDLSLELTTLDIFTSHLDAHDDVGEVTMPLYANT